MTVGYYDAQDRYHYAEGFAVNPVDLLKQQAAARGVPTSTGQAKRAGAQLLQQQLQQRGIPTSSRQVQRQLQRQAEKEIRKGLKRVAGPEAEKIKSDVLKAMKLPGNIPVPLPAEMSVEGVKNAALNAGADYMEKELQRQTGLPIPVPRSLSVKEIERSITGILPADAGEAIELGITIGIQYASSALASVLAGAAIGSAIPGLGTVIGIGMALGVEAIKSALKEPPTVKPCKAKFPIRRVEGSPGSFRVAETYRQCPPFPQTSAMGLLPWLARTVVPFRAELKRMDGGALCHGPVQQCASILMTVSANAYNMSKKTPQVLGYYQLGQLIPQYQAAMQLPRSRAQDDIKLLLPAMLKRQQQLAALIAKADQVERLSARDIASLRWNLVTEFRSAGAQFALDQGPDTRQWLATLGKYMQRLQAREGAVVQERQQRQVQQTARFEQRKGDPKEQVKHVLQQLQMACGQDNAAACREYKRIAAGGALTAAQLKQFGGAARPAPRSAPATPRIDPNLFKRCHKIVTDLVAKNPRASKCLTRSDIDKLTRICALAYKPQPQITPQKALLLMMQYADNACKARGL
jgi:hypothetical protein